MVVEGQRWRSAAKGTSTVGSSDKQSFRDAAHLGNALALHRGGGASAEEALPVHTQRKHDAVVQCTPSSELLISGDGQDTANGARVAATGRCALGVATGLASPSGSTPRARGVRGSCAPCGRPEACMLCCTQYMVRRSSGSLSRERLQVRVRRVSPRVVSRAAAKRLRDTEMTIEANPNIGVTL